MMSLREKRNGFNLGEWLLLGLLATTARVLLSGCAAPPVVEKPGAEQVAAADSTGQLQVVTRLDGKAFKKSMTYPYLVIKFHQNDTEVEMVLDPQKTNLNLELVRAKNGQFQIMKGDSVIYPREDSTEAPEALTDLKPGKKPADENLTDELIRDINEAQNLFYQERYDDALRILRASLEKRETAAAYALGGSIYYVNGNLKQAVKAWENALKIDPDLDEVRQMVERYKNGNN
ncbi:MAG: hypothetical protein D6743_17935 [Calditrichaeota bacterium]|nr:MAG: hypothetical protein D6743_17935 [Calditrichota bacterium]